MATILVVDDSISMRQLVSFALKSDGHEILQAGDGVEAITVAKKTQANLVITDANMPNMDGLTLIKTLRELPSYEFIPMLVLTTESNKEIKKKGRQAGASGWILKPFNPEQLQTTVKRVLG